LSVRTRLALALVLVGIVTAVLIFTAATRASSLYLTVPELQRLGAKAVGENLSVSGTILGRTVEWDPVHQRLAFTIRDDTTGQVLPVVYHGPKPDEFTNDWPVIVSGELQPDGTFTAEQLLIKCPSKYEAANTVGTAGSGD
jgi:cytochrome c-type biogenesis protein CcmE